MAFSPFNLPQKGENGLPPKPPNLTEAYRLGSLAQFGEPFNLSAKLDPYICLLYRQNMILACQFRGYHPAI